MRITSRGGLTWRRGIDGWWLSIQGVHYRAVQSHEGFKWSLYQGRKLEYRGTTFAGVAQQLVSDLCPFDHETHDAACAEWILSRGSGAG